MNQHEGSEGGENGDHQGLDHGDEGADARGYQFETRIHEPVVARHAEKPGDQEARPVGLRDAPGAQPQEPRHIDDAEDEVAHGNRVFVAQRQRQRAHEHGRAAPDQHGGNEGENGACPGADHPESKRDSMRARCSGNGQSGRHAGRDGLGYGGGTRGQVALIRPVGHLLPSLRDGRRRWGPRVLLLLRSNGRRWPTGRKRALRVRERLKPRPCRP